MALKLILMTHPLDTAQHFDSELPQATLAELVGERVILHASCSAPPGAPLTLCSSDGRVFEARTRGCRRSSQAGFVLEARLVNLSRTERAWLEQFMNQPAPPD